VTGLFIAISIILAYLLGSFPSAYLVARYRKGIDIRTVGSRNMGAMNTFYKVGFWYGILVLCLDISKGVLAVAIPTLFGLDQIFQLIAGAIVVLGHAFPVFLNFKGGKGGATCIGVLVFLIPWGVPAYALIFGVILLITRFPTLSYAVAFLCFPFLAWLVYHSQALIIFSIAILLIPGIKYIPRIIEIRSKSGGWKHLFLRHNLKDRF
jgi:acyl phosphate:glycerol-3-phosphate acyltransferase